MAEGVVEYVGQPIAIIAGESREAIRQAKKKIRSTSLRLPSSFRNCVSREKSKSELMATVLRLGAGPFSGGS